MPLNDMNPSIIEPDSSNSKLFGGVNETGVGAPGGESEVDGFSDGVMEPRTEDKEGEILYINPVSDELPQSGIQPNDTPNRPARVAAKPSRFRDDQFGKTREVGLGLGKGEPTAVQQEEQPHMKPMTPAGQGCQALGKGELNRITQCNSETHGSVKNSLIQSLNDSSHYLLRKRGHRLGWPTWPKVRFKSHAQNRWKFRFRALSRRSVRFKPPTGSCKLSRDTYRVRTLNRRRVIRFRTHYQAKPSVRKKQHPLLRPTKMVLENSLSKEIFRVRMLNRGISEAVSSMHHPHTLPTQGPVQCGKPGADEQCTSGCVEDSTQHIQAVTPHFHQKNAPQCASDKSKESLLRNNYGSKAIMNELSAAPQPTGAQSKQSSQVHAPGPEENSYGEKAINGQWPRSALTACAGNRGANVSTPPRGSKWSLTRHVGEALKWRD